MKLQHTAKEIIGFPGCVPHGKVAQVIGVDGMAEALRRGWLVVDAEVGGLRTSPLSSVLEQMRDAASGKLRVGDPVTIVDGGQPYQGAVSTVNADGSVSVSFGERRPKTVKTSYRPEELATSATPTPPTGATTPTTTTVTGVRGPGLGS
jgi:hypothetical protein